MKNPGAQIRNAPIEPQILPELLSERLSSRLNPSALLPQSPEMWSVHPQLPGYSLSVTSTGGIYLFLFSV